MLAAALEVFDLRGYEAATMEKIAERAGVSKGSVYNYFRSKEDLFAKVFGERLLGDHAEADELVEGSSSAWEKLQHLMDYVFRRLKYYTRCGRLVMEFWAHAARQREKGELAKSLVELHGRWRRRIESILVQGIEAGEFGRHVEPAITASLIWAAVNGMIVQAMFDPEADTGERSLSTLKRGLLDGLRASNSAAK